MIASSGDRAKHRTALFLSLGLSAMSAGAGSHAAYAADLTIPAAATSPAPAPVPWLLGDWNGARTRLLNAGIDFQFGYTSELAGNATGGQRQQVAYTDQWVFGATFDLAKLGVVPGGTIQVTWTDRNGSNLSDDARLGTLQQVQEVFGRGQTLRLTDFWYDQKFVNGMVDWKIGRIPFGEDFASFACDFQNLTFCGAQPGNLVGNYIYNWPVSYWATRLKFNIQGFGYFQFGVFDSNPGYLDVSQSALPVIYSGSTGLLIPAELAWLPKFGDLQGSYKFGGWYDTSTAPNVVTDINGNPAVLSGLPPQQSRGRYGGYISFVQQVLRPSQASSAGALSLFLNATMADRRTATTDYQIAGGLTYTGPLPSRPQDDIGFAVGTTHVNSRVAWSEELQNLAGLGPIAVQGNEYAIEFYYTYRPLPGLQIRPNIQYVIDPGGTSANPNALVFGLKTVANF
ncbi:carbohydrate porin [Bradyrhizobium sp. LTSP885]|uniref:carbohydrate porin n=1 Tax=Bradyrhizobium sp. LTSP885 TaxID=1619232 RepID=UPI000B1C2515|nr:carbohydrate porin [Bradyrhizobium sp. LTSP885]